MNNHHKLMEHYSKFRLLNQLLIVGKMEDLNKKLFEYEYFIQEAHIYTDMYFCYIVYTKYSGSQSHIAVSFNTVRGYETRRI